MDDLIRAMRIGETSDNREVMAYACGCLVWTCTDLGQLDEALVYSGRAVALFQRCHADVYLDKTQTFVTAQQLNG